VLEKGVLQSLLDDFLKKYCANFKINIKIAGIKIGS
jgi:hypothetical protein